MLIDIPDAHIDYLKQLLTSELEGGAEFVADVGNRHLDGDVDKADDLVAILSDPVKNGGRFVNIFEVNDIDGVYVFEDEDAMLRFEALRGADDDINHGSTPIVNNAYVCAWFRDAESWTVMFEERGVASMVNVPDPTLTAFFDDLRNTGYDVEGADQQTWDRDIGPWLDTWAERFKTDALQQHVASLGKGR